MTALVVGALGLLGVLDGTFAGFRASSGRDGLVRLRRKDLVAAARGLATLLLTPVVALGVAGLVRDTHRFAVYRTAAVGMATVCLPYGVLMLLALTAYLTLDWRRRHLASALPLGPLTFARPLVALAGAAPAAWRTGDLVVTVLAFSVVAILLGVEPTAGRCWYAARASTTTNTTCGEVHVSRRPGACALVSRSRER